MLMRHSKTVFAVAFVLLFVGAGCAKIADQAAEQAVQPIAVPLRALDDSKKTLAGVQAGLNRDGAETDQDTIVVTLVLTEGSQLPYGAVLGAEFGCGDRLAVSKVKRISDSGDQAFDALNSLLAVKDASANGLYDALAQSSLKVEKIAPGKDGLAEVRLVGQPLSGGTCDDPRIKSQVEETVRRFLPKFRVILNGTEAAWRCFGDMSGNCK